MNERLRLAAAANTLAPALAALRQKGYTVSRRDDSYRAESAARLLLADDLLQLLGLVALLDERGDSWHPTDEEIQALLDLEGMQDPAT